MTHSAFLRLAHICFQRVDVLEGTSTTSRGAARAWLNSCSVADCPLPSLCIYHRSEKSPAQPRWVRDPRYTRAAGTRSLLASTETSRQHYLRLRLSALARFSICCPTTTLCCYVETELPSTFPRSTSHIAEPLVRKGDLQGGSASSATCCILRFLATRHPLFRSRNFYRCADGSRAEPYNNAHSRNSLRSVAIRAVDYQLALE